MKKIVILLSCLLSACNVLGSNEPEAASNAVKSQSFIYKNEVFSLHITSDVDQETPSLAGLYQDALARKTHLDSLFDHVKNAKFDKSKNKEIFNHTDYMNKLLCSAGHSDRSQYLRMIHILQAEYMPERDLVDYFLQALERFAQTPPSQAQIQELYKQAVYTCRMNLSSIQTGLFGYLSYTYPQAFWIQGNSMFQDKDFTSYHTDEDRFYASIRDQYSREIGKPTFLNTVDIANIARYCMRSPVAFTNPNLVFEFNSLFFYLNIERALLSACPDLVFDPSDYAFQKEPELQNRTFALSRIADYHRKGAFYVLMQNPRPSEKQFPPYLRIKDRLLDLTLNNKARAH